MTFVEWLKDETENCSKTEIEIKGLKEQLDILIIEHAIKEYPNKKIENIFDVDLAIGEERHGTYRDGYPIDVYDVYDVFSTRFSDVSDLHCQIDVKRNDLEKRRSDLESAQKFDNGVEFLSVVAKQEHLSSEIGKLQERLEATKKDTDMHKSSFIKSKKDYERLMQEFDESHKDVA